jgi:hypothetical protein
VGSLGPPVVSSVPSLIHHAGLQSRLRGTMRVLKTLDPQ